MRMLISFATIIIMLMACASDGPEEGQSAEPVRVPVTITGNEAVGAADLEFAARHELKSFNEHRRFADLGDAAFAMMRRIRSEGFPSVEVRPEALPEGAEMEAVTSLNFVVEQGSACLVNLVRIDQDEATEELNLHRFVVGLEGEPYRRSTLHAAASEIEAACLLAGYHDVLIEDIEPGLSEDETAADPVIKIKAGPVWHMKVGAWPDALRPILGDALDTILDDDPIYHVRRPAEIAARLRVMLRERGYQGAEIAYATDLNHESSEAQVEITATPGRPYTLGKIEIEGLERTHAGFVENVIDILENATLTQPEIDAALDRLHRTAIFDRIDFDLAPSDDDEDMESTIADIILEVEEAEAKSVEFFVGFGTYELARAGVKYRDRNLFGVGRIFDAELSGSVRSARFETGITDPYTLGRPNTLRATLGAEYRQEPSFTRSSIDGQLAVRHDFDARRSITGGYRFLYSSVSDVTAILPDDVGAEGESTEAGLFVNYRDDQRDDAILPTSGYVLNAGAFWSADIFLADLEFFELSASIFDHQELWEGGVLAYGIRGATRQPIGNTDDLPIQQRYFLGGESSVRSFFEAELGPFDSDRNAIGGLSFAEAHVELRQQLIGDLHGAFFYDIGTVGLESFDFDGPYGQAIGIGFRYYLPIGPMRIDFGYNPGRRFAASSRFAIHFGFGFSF